MLPLASHVMRCFGEIRLCGPSKIVRKIRSLHAYAAAKKNWFSCAAVQKRFVIRASVWCENSLRGVTAAALH